MIIQIRPKETKLDRFLRTEKLRLETRRQPVDCKRCRWRVTSHSSGLCRECRNYVDV